MLKAKGCISDQIIDHFCEVAVHILHTAAKEGLGSHPQGQVHNLMRDVNRLPIFSEAFQRIQHHLGLLYDHTAQGIDPVAMEGGLHQAPLAQPEIAITGDQAIAKNQSHTSERKRIFRIIVLIVLHDALDRIRVKNRYPFGWSKPDPDNLAIFPLQVDQELHAVALDIRQAAE